MALSEGTQIGPYEVIGLIGQGGMGEVWQARDTKLDRDVVLKVLEFSLENHHDEKTFSQDAVWCRRGTLPSARPGGR